MAQLLPPVCTDRVKFQNPVQIFCSRDRFPLLGKNCVNWSGGRRKGLGRMRVASQDSASYEDIADDYYAVLGLLPDATQKQIKKAYHCCMKACHPDLSGDDPETTNFCMFINEVYTCFCYSDIRCLLSDPVRRMVYDEIHGYALTAINSFWESPAQRIMYLLMKPRAYCQSGNPDSVQQALSLLEDEMRKVERVNVALMLSGMGSAFVDIFRMASSRWEKRQAKVLEQAKIRMMRQDYDKSHSYWSHIWGKPRDYETTEEEVKERAPLAAAAAWRWRVYSRRGVDKPPTFKLPEAVSNKEY
ncbi:hypothetical protein Pfo_022516 [Paulownia fortunei]|nr:hypothetical protein Pfo_022516 [Paulownia fortunei]